MVQRERGGKEGLLFFINSLRCISPPVASRTCDLEAKQIIKKQTTNNMQVSKFSSFRVYCRKRGKTDKLKISKASSWFSILLLGLHLLFLILFLLSLLFVLFLLSFWSLVFYGEFLQLLCHFVCAISVACDKQWNVRLTTNLWKFPYIWHFHFASQLTVFRISFSSYISFMIAFGPCDLLLLWWNIWIVM